MCIRDRDKGAGGLIVLVTGNGSNHTGTVESYYTGLAIEGNDVYNVCHEAIYMESVWARDVDKRQVVDFNCNGLEANEYGWWKVTGGQVDFTYTGLEANEYGWWMVINGKIDFNYNGLQANEYGWWKVTNGKVDFTYNGVARNEYGWWYVTGGKIDFGYTGLVKILGVMCPVVNGKVMI